MDLQISLFMFKEKLLQQRICSSDQKTLVLISHQHEFVHSCFLCSPSQPKAFCHLNVKSPVIKKTQEAAHCRFSQFQGNVYVVMYPGNRSPLEFNFPSAQQNQSYKRTNHQGGIRF